MARKKTEAKPVEAIAEVTKPVRLDLSAETHRLLRLVAAFHGQSMASFARDLVENHVRNEASERGIKP